MGDSTGGHGYHTTSSWQHLVREYTGLTLPEVMELDYYQYLIWRRDAWIDYLSRSERGQNYLQNAWRMEQTEPDRIALRKQCGRKAMRQHGKQGH